MQWAKLWKVLKVLAANAPLVIGWIEDLARKQK